MNNQELSRQTENANAGSLHPGVRCCVEVRAIGMNFTRYHQCKRIAVTKDDLGNPVCKQHSPAEKTLRREKAEAIRLKRLRLRLAYLHSKNAAAPNNRI